MNNVVSRTSFEDMKSRMRTTEVGEPMQTTGEAPEGAGAGGTFNSVVAKDAGFFRKGEVGSWKRDFNQELIQEIDEWTEENITERLNYNFSYSI